MYLHNDALTIHAMCHVFEFKFLMQPLSNEIQHDILPTWGKRKRIRLMCKTLKLI